MSAQTLTLSQIVARAAEFGERDPDTNVVAVRRRDCVADGLWLEPESAAEELAEANKTIAELEAELKIAEDAAAEFERKGAEAVELLREVRDGETNISDYKSRCELAERQTHQMRAVYDQMAHELGLLRKRKGIEAALMPESRHVMMLLGALRGESKHFDAKREAGLIFRRIADRQMAEKMVELSRVEVAK